MSPLCGSLQTWVRPGVGVDTRQRLPRKSRSDSAPRQQDQVCVHSTYGVVTVVVFFIGGSPTISNFYGDLCSATAHRSHWIYGEVVVMLIVASKRDGHSINYDYGCLKAPGPDSFLGGSPPVSPQAPGVSRWERGRLSVTQTSPSRFDSLPAHRVPDLRGTVAGRVFLAGRTVSQPAGGPVCRPLAQAPSATRSEAAASTAPLLRSQGAQTREPGPGAFCVARSDPSRGGRVNRPAPSPGPGRTPRVQPPSRFCRFGRDRRPRPGACRCRFHRILRSPGARGST
ncbi:hypothetical protein NDU88_003031 [Pleurodeles waltl]|uniref:Uncharacterized protein n=1 Tax=Pleurodeles waltl TaxID=8319 RepID=A0AAV7KVU9_PLEWA|nr:hypothetical protein NDU88_003031 [Pleurodeles waltl]